MKNINDFEYQTENVIQVYSENEKENEFLNKALARDLDPEELKEITEEAFETEDRRTLFKNIGAFEGLLGLDACVYILYNSYHNRYYVGETIMLQKRFLLHINLLERGKHKNRALQEDYNELKEMGKEAFKVIQGKLIFQRYYSHIQTANFAKKIIGYLCLLESQQIAFLVEKGEYVYNIAEMIGTPCIIKGKFYRSISQAHQALKVSRLQIKSDLNNQNKPDYKLLRERDQQKGIKELDKSKISKPVYYRDPLNLEVKYFESYKSLAKYFQGLDEGTRNFLKKNYNFPFTRKSIVERLKKSDQDPYFRYEDTFQKSN